MRIAGAHEIRVILGVSRQRVYQLAARDDFPKPVAILAQGKVWLIDDIELWKAEHRPPAEHSTGNKEDHSAGSRTGSR